MEENIDKDPIEDKPQLGRFPNEPSPFYPPPEKEKSKKTFILILIMVGILLVTGFIALATNLFNFRSQIKNLVVGEASPTPAPTSTSTFSPTPIPNPLIRSDWSLEVLNGSGVSGLAKKVAEQLSDLGYPVVKTGNADKQTYKTTEILVKGDLKDRVDSVVADLRDVIKIASVAGELEEGTASARIIIGKDVL